LEAKSEKNKKVEKKKSEKRKISTKMIVCLLLHYFLEEK